MNKSFYNFAFIGSGLSCTYTLIHLLTNIKRTGSKHACKILVVEKAGEFWTGIPYGMRSGTNSLIITSLKDFIPVSERELFVEFLNSNLDQLLKDFIDKGGKLSSDWKIRNKELIDLKKWDDIYLPRYFYGEFLKQRVNDLLKETTEEELIEYELRQAEVNGIRKEKGKYIVSLSGGDDETIVESEKVILSVGSPPKKPFIKLDTPNKAFTVIEDMYEPTVASNIESLIGTLKKNEKKSRVLVIGSNASALEFFYNINNYPELNQLVERYYVVSPGKFPHRITVGADLENYSLSHLNKLKDRKRFTAADILNAVKKDTEAAEKAGINVADIINETSVTIIELLNKLSFPQQREFVYDAGVEIGKLQRRAGHEYLGIIQALLEEDRLELIQGKFLKASQSQGGMLFEYKTPEGDVIAFDTTVQAIINCAGFEDLSDNSVSPLIRNLITDKICKPNKSQRGFWVNEKFEANKNLFIMGPLLAGNINKNLRVWHAESCSRIFSLSQQLAKNLVD